MAAAVAAGPEVDGGVAGVLGVNNRGEHTEGHRLAGVKTTDAGAPHASGGESVRQGSTLGNLQNVPAQRSSSRALK